MEKMIVFFCCLIAASVAAQESRYNVRDYGAKGDAKSNSTKAINAAINAAAKKGGGTVYFPAGKYLSYTIHLQSKITLYLDQGAVLIGASEMDGVGYDVPDEAVWYSKFQDFGHS